MIYQYSINIVTTDFAGGFRYTKNQRQFSLPPVSLFGFNIKELHNSLRLSLIGESVCVLLGDF